jgi:hypothetical protein
MQLTRTTIRLEKIANTTGSNTAAIATPSGSLDNSAAH